MNELILKHLEDFINYHRVDRGHEELTLKVYKNSLLFIFEIIENQILRKEFEAREKKKSKIESLLQNYSFEQINHTHIRSLLAILKDSYDNSKSTISNKLSILRSFYKYLKKYNIINNNIMEMIDLPKLSYKISEVPTENDIIKLFTTLIERNYRNDFEKKSFLLYFYLKFTIMARNIEMIRIKVKHIHFENKKILVRGKGDKERLLPLDDKTIELIKDYIIIAKLTDEDHLIRNRFNKPTSLRSLEKRVQIVRDEAGLKKWMTSHPLLRKSPATKMWKEGLRLIEVQDLLGHANPETTRIYVKPLMSDIEKKLEEHHPLEFIHKL